MCAWNHQLFIVVNINIESWVFDDYMIPPNVAEPLQNICTHHQTHSLSSYSEASNRSHLFPLISLKIPISAPTLESVSDTFLTANEIC